jgi:hypothetical protein
MQNCTYVPEELKGALRNLHELHSQQIQALPKGSQRKLCTHVYNLFKKIPVEKSVKPTLEQLKRTQITTNPKKTKRARGPSRADIAKETMKRCLFAQGSSYIQCLQCRMVPFELRTPCSVLFEIPSKMDVFEHHYKECCRDGIHLELAAHALGILASEYGLEVVESTSFKGLVELVVGANSDLIQLFCVDILKDPVYLEFSGTTKNGQTAHRPPPSEYTRGLWRELPTSVDTSQVERAFQAVAEEFHFESNVISEHPKFCRFISIISPYLMLEKNDNDVMETSGRDALQSQSDIHMDDDQFAAASEANNSGMVAAPQTSVTNHSNNIHEMATNNVDEEKTDLHEKPGHATASLNDPVLVDTAQQPLVASDAGKSHNIDEQKVDSNSSVNKTNENQGDGTRSAAPDVNEPNENITIEGVVPDKNDINENRTEGTCLENDDQPVLALDSSDPNHNGKIGTVGDLDDGVNKEKVAAQAPVLATNTNRCIPLHNPIPIHVKSHLKNDDDADDEDNADSSSDNADNANVTLPEFHCIVNFPDYLCQTKNNDADNTSQKYCVMCGKLRLFAASEGYKAQYRNDHYNAASNHDESQYIIPAQNKLVCTQCDVTVWRFTPSSATATKSSTSTNGEVQQQHGNDACSGTLEIKWCKGCKNFKAWAAFGDKGGTTKCERCRSRQQERYALQKETTTKAKLESLRLQASSPSTTSTLELNGFDSTNVKPTENSKQSPASVADENGQ